MNTASEKPNNSKLAFSSESFADQHAREFKNVRSGWHQLDKPPETVIKQHLPKDVTLKKVGDENANESAEVCDWVKHAQTIEARQQMNAPKKVEPEPDFDVEALLAFTPNPAALVGWLSDLGLSDPEYCASRLNEAGFSTEDDVMLGEPSMDDLISYGFDHEEDRKKFYYAIHPEERQASEKQDGPDVLELEMANHLLQEIIQKMDTNTATNEDLQHFLLLKAKLGH